MIVLSSLFRHARCDLVAAGLLALCLGAPAGAQSGPQVSGHPDSRIHVYSYAFQHKLAVEAMPLVQPLMTRKGTIELQPEDNALVIRDTVAALGRIVPALRAYDQPPQELRIEVMIVRAASRPMLGTGSDGLPEWLEDKLRSLLRWDFYALLSRSGFTAREGQAVTHEVGRRYGLSFRPGTLGAGEQVKLHDFRIWQVGEEAGEPLLEATLNLWLDKPKVLGLANSESSGRALMVVLTCERLGTPAEVGASDADTGGDR